MRPIPAAMALLMFAWTPLVAQDKPKPMDGRLRLTLFAEQPQIVTPTGLCVDANGHVLVIENHTHFPPKQYTGRKTDRILRMKDADGDGKAEKISTFYDGFRDGMDLARAPDGAIYLATRRAIVRLEDRDGDGRAEKATSIVTLKTEGNYPHNGLSGLSFDADSTLHFGFGENLGKPYDLVGTDGTTLRGGGEGGTTYRIRPDGAELKRISRGYWNPFGMCFDVWGNLFAVDNDPDSSPPCRLIHVVEGGDYGYQYRYGRSGISPLHAWNGQLPGTLPMVAGTGEAPCGILAYESTGLPSEYRGQLLVASWSDHRIERYELQRHGASFKAKMSVLVRGGEDFRPVDMAVAHDGSIYFSDWVDRSYKLHGKGRLWRLHWDGAPQSNPPSEKDLTHADQRRREQAARRAVRSGAEGLAKLKKLGTDPNQSPRTRLTALRALAVADADRTAPLLLEQLKDPKLPVDAQAALVRWLPVGADDDLLKADRPAPVRLANAPRNGHPQRLLDALDDPDPFIRAAATASPDAIQWLESESSIKTARHRIGLLQALGHTEGRDTLLHTDMGYLLASKHADVRLFALRLIAEGKLKEFRPEVTELLDAPTTSAHQATVAFAVLAHLDDQSVDGHRAHKQLRSIAGDPKRSEAARASALGLLPASALPPIESFETFLKNNGPLRTAAVEQLHVHPDAKRLGLLAGVAQDDKAPLSVRLWAVVGMDPNTQAETLMQLASQPSTAAEAMRTLGRGPLSDEQKNKLSALPKGPTLNRLLGKPYAEHPPLQDVDGWAKALEGKGDRAVGRRIFFGIGLCATCHRHQNRGARTGPDLTRIGAGRNKRQLLRAILNPAADVAPRYQPWLIQTRNGQSISGFHAATKGDQEQFIDASGKSITVKADQIVLRQPLDGSIMPPGLLHRLTLEEARDLLAFLIKPP